MAGAAFLKAQVLFAAHRDGVFRYLCRIVGQNDATDLTQEVFLRVARTEVPHALQNSASGASVNTPVNRS